MDQFFQEIFDFFSGPGSALAVTAAFAALLVQLLIFIFGLRREISISYRVSVIGLPRSGKTALISALFDYIFHSTSGAAFSPVGEQTINRINNQILVLDSRKVFPPTKEDDVFIFRFIYYIRRLLVVARIRYEGEIVDFPGEMSGALIRSAQDGNIVDDVPLFHREFYSWILSSKAHIFVIDLADFLVAEDRNSFAAARTAEIRKTWQLLNEEINRAQRSRTRRIALVFAKADLIIHAVSSDYSKPLDPMFVNDIRMFGYQKAPESTSDFDVSESDINKLQMFILNEFRFLIDYFDKQEGVKSVFFTSSYKNGSGDRMGIADLAKFLLPRAEF